MISNSSSSVSSRRSSSLLPFYIFGIFLSMTQSGQVSGILGIFLKLIVIIFVMTVVLLLIQFSIAGLVASRIR